MVEQAKGVLVQRRGMRPHRAYGRLQELAAQRHEPLAVTSRPAVSAATQGRVLGR